ncbi:MAG: ATP-binding protein, partial [Acidimicrobiia bacterium]
MTAAGGGGRSTATVLFTDLVSSTERWSRLGEAAAETVRRTHDRLLAEAVSLHQGQVVKGLGDGIMATFVGAADAVDAAVAIQRAFERHNRSAEPDSRFDARIGISSGDVSFEAGDCFGAPVVEAARLCQGANGGQILVSQVVRLLVGGQAGYRFAGVGSLQLKGLPVPVEASEVDWATDEGLSIPLPAVIQRAAAFRFVGRRNELERLAGAWKQAAAGGRMLFLVAGEAGIGKTRLMAEMAQAVHPEGAVVLYGRCEEEMGLPYQPFAEALGRYVAACPAPDLRDQLGPLGGEVTRLVPTLVTRVPGIDEPLRGEPETERYRLLEAVRDFLSGISRSAPVLLLLDDLHWAGKPTLLLLRHLLRAGETNRILIVAAYRDSDVSRDSALAQTLADIRRDSDVERLSLQGLDEGETTAFIEAAAGHVLEPDDLAFAHAVYSETDGNPFFVGELLRHLAETGAVIREEPRWRISLPLEELGIPEGVREIVNRRLARLAPSAHEVLHLAAVIGREFDVGLLAAAGEVTRDVVLDSLEAAEEARLVAATSGRVQYYAFAHALVRSALYEDIPSTRRLRLHRRVGEALEARPDADAHLPELARHFGQAAGLGEVVRAVDYARRAGDRAGAGLAFEEALGYYRHALNLLDTSEAETEADGTLRCDLLISLGEAQRRAGDGEYRATLLGAARLAELRHDGDRLARAALANHRAFFSLLNVVDEERVQVAEAALEALGREDSTTRARLLVTLASELVFATDPERRLQLATAGLDMARRLGDLPTLADTLVRGYIPIFTSLDVAALWAHTAELGRVAEQLGDPALAFWGKTWGFMTAVVAGDLDAARSLIET